MPVIPYLIRTFRGGISDETNKGVKGSWKNSYGLDIHKRTDSLSAKQAMLTIFGNSTTTQTGLINFFVPASDGTTYAFGSTGSIFAISGNVNDPVVTFVYNDENGGIKGAAEWKDSGGTNYLYWATGTSVARKLLQGADVTPDSGTARWTDATQDYKTTLTANGDNTWHTMKVAAGILNIANANSVAIVDYDANYNLNAVNPRPGNIVKCIDERDDYVIFGTFRQDNSEEGHLWSWFPLTPATATSNWSQKKRIAGSVNAIIQSELMLLQAGTKGEIYFSDFVNALPLHGVPNLEGAQVYPGGVSTENGIAVFGVFGGDSSVGIWSYGRKRKNRPYAFNMDYRLASTVTGSTVSTIGAITNISGYLLSSWGTTDGSTSDYGVDMVSSTTKASAIFEGLEFTNGMPHLKKYFDSVKFIMTPLPSGTSVSAKFKLDNESVWRYAVLGDGTTTYSSANSVEAEFTIGDKSGQILEVGAELNASANTTPEITSIITYVSQETYEHG